MITKENRAHRKIFLRDHGERRGRARHLARTHVKISEVDSRGHKQVVMAWQPLTWRSWLMRVAVIRHHDVDSASFVGEAFEARGAEFDVRLFPGGSLPALDGVDHAVVLGSYSSVNDEDAWIAEELDWLRRADAAGVPVLGVCFGGQALCAVFGGRVEKMDREEIGWEVIDTSDADLVPTGPWLEFHGDRCLPPPAARVLARNEIAVQAFSIGRHLAVQFHPECDGAQLKRWLDGGGLEHVRSAGVDPDQLLARTIREEPAARERADRLVAGALRIAAASPPSWT
jgi:GMP synthase-like glutamine amidotransferase